MVRTKPGGQRLGAEKGINLSDTVLPLTALTPEDNSYLPFVAAHADLVAISFVRTADDVQYVLDAVGALDDILARMGEVQRKSRTLMRRIHSWDAQ